MRDSNEEELADILEVLYVICDFKKIDRKLIQKKMRVTLENQTKETKEIEVIHNISGDWTILNNNINYRKINAHQIKFIVSIKAGGKQIINWSERIKN